MESILFVILYGGGIFLASLLGLFLIGFVGCFIFLFLSLGWRAAAKIIEDWF